ncbi:hypothetical protein LTR78_000222 [Recurvomyces mirabilis]|uniref:Uncharacterized protein n=1 Tax=Recurvomyces mirabilis TaxID=574656 RepID=A0AAE0WXQ9_9PEZI|nr:hypothetical protein LTR78_000222 [Recurvomyces mirabilis]KAK5161878.1 hypothetical protein LTS14_000223 [Recurvomyces mirabilis]
MNDTEDLVESTEGAGVAVMPTGDRGGSKVVLGKEAIGKTTIGMKPSTIPLEGNDPEEIGKNTTASASGLGSGEDRAGAVAAKKGKGPYNTDSEDDETYDDDDGEDDGCWEEDDDAWQGGRGWGSGKFRSER